MAEWWTYSAEDFLLFSARTYWRLVERYNEALWPAQLLALAAGGLILACLTRPRAWTGPVVAALLAAGWAWIAWGFLWARYAVINWAAAYAVPVFALQALLLLWPGSRLGWRLTATARGWIGLGLFVAGLLAYPLLAPAGGRPIAAMELFGVMPDPTAVATLGLLLMAAARRAVLLMLVPAAWCLAGGATLYAMGSSQAWLPLAAAALALAGTMLPRTR
ncbi:MAG: DUF6064 family protein [Dongiaceae bacterium]